MKPPLPLLGTRPGSRRGRPTAWIAPNRPLEPLDATALTRFALPPATGVNAKLIGVRSLKKAVVSSTDNKVDRFAETKGYVTCVDAVPVGVLRQRKRTSTTGIEIDAHPATVPGSPYGGQVVKTGRW